MPEPTPVILLTFANDLDDRVRYLRHLSEEARRLRRALEDPDRAGRCQMEIRQNASLDDILDALQDFRNQVAIFHYGGHAGSFGLLVETPDGHPATAHAAGLAAFLAQQSRLLLVFLNGCSTQAQVQGLLDAGVSVVIATAQSIDDGVATEFAGRFYQGLASGATLGEAYEEAVAARQSAHGSNPRHLYTAEGLDDEDVDPSRWPWELKVRPGAEEALEWRLPEAAQGAGEGGPGMYIDAREGGQVSIDTAVFGPYIQGVGTGHGAQTGPPEAEPDTAHPGTARPAQPETGSPQEDQEEPTTPPAQGRGGRMRPPPRAALQWFVNRERERERFGRMLAGTDTTTRVLAISGPEGIGKTWLRKRLYAEARQQQVPAFALEFDPGEAFNELSLLQKAALALGGQEFPRLWGMLEEAARQEVLIKVDAPATSAGLTVHGDVEIQQVVEGPVFQGVNFIVPAKTPEEGKLWWKQWQPRITEAFFQDLAVLGQTQGAALLFDRYESTTKEAQDWIEKKLLQRVCEDGLGHVWVVLVGEELPYLSADWGGLVVPLTLDPWSATVVREYLPKRCVTIGEPGAPSPEPQQLQPDDSCEEYVIISEESVSVIFGVTGGRPDQIALLADFRQELREPLDEAQVQEILARGILTKTRGPVREALRSVAPAAWFDVELLAALIEAPQAAGERIKELSAYSFVQQEKPGRYHLATRARQVLLASWDRQSQQLVELHARLARHLEKRATAEQDPQLRRKLRRQAMDHWFAADENVGRQRLCALFEEAEQGYWLSECDLLINHAEEAPGLSALTQTWLTYLRGRLALARDDRGTSLAQFEDVKREVDTGSELYALAEWSLGQVAAENGDWEGATRHYEDSLQTFTAQKDEARQGQVMLSLGAVHLNQARALGASLQPRLLEAGGGKSWLRAAAAPLVGLGFLIYALTNRRWRLPRWQYAMSYTNWTLARLLLTAQQWFTTAEARLSSAGKEELIPDAQRQLAQTYHFLGWERDAQSLFQQLLSSGPVSSSAYRKAQVRRDLAESELSAGHTGNAISQLKESLQTFEGHEDRQAQAEVNALLGRAYLEKGDKGDFEQGLMLLRTSLAEFARLGDRVGAGLALHALRGWLERSRPTAEQADKAQAVLAETQEKVYFPRVADRSAQKVEVVASAGLLLLLVVGLPILMAVIILTPVNELAQARIVLRFALWLLLVLGIFVIILGGLGLALIQRGARRSQRPEPLDRIVTGPDAIRRVDHTGERKESIPWEEVQAVVSVDRVLWRAPLTLLSHFQIIGRQALLRVPATMRWYSALRQDVEDHLRERGAAHTRLRLDARLPLIPVLLVSLVLLIVGALVVYAVIPLLNPPQLSAWMGTTLMFLGVMGLLLGSTWWLVIHPLLWVRYHLEPRSWRVPLAAGLTGLGVVAVGWWLRWQHPFHPLRNWLEWTAFPVGYLLLLAACLWVLTARLRPALGAQRSGPAYPLWLRAVILPVLLALAGLTGLFVRSEWLPYLSLFRALACYQGQAYECTIQSAEEALAINPNIADGYYLRALASTASDDPQTAVDDLTHVIELDTESMAMYRWYRAQAYQALGDLEAACADLRGALDAPRWGLSAEKRELALKHWDTWECSSTPE